MGGHVSKLIIVACSVPPSWVPFAPKHLPFVIAWASDGVCLRYEVESATVTVVGAPGAPGPRPVTAMVLPDTEATVP
jgi:hypothetical protein